MAPQAKLFLVESKLCGNKQCDTDPFWDAVTLGAKLVAENGGGVISMSWATRKFGRKHWDKYFTHQA